MTCSICELLGRDHEAGCAIANVRKLAAANGGLAVAPGPNLGFCTDCFPPIGAQKIPTRWCRSTCTCSCHATAFDHEPIEGMKKTLDSSNK